MPADQQTFDQLKGLWLAVDGNPGEADLAASVAMAESTGCQYALAGPVDIRPVKECTWHKTRGENSCGYWQINLYAHKDYSAPYIFDEYENARAAKAISNNGSDWNAWSTYVDGAYKQFLAQFAGQAATAPPPPPVSGPDKYGDTPTLPNGVWNEGWQHFTKQLSHTLPAALTASQQAGERTLHTLARRRKVVH